MNALGKGAKVGRAYISRVNPKTTTVIEMGAMARTCARECYRSEAKQKEFVSGWLAVSQQFLHMFKDYPTQRNIKSVILECQRCGEEVKVSWPDKVPDIGDIRKAQLLPCPVCHE